MNKVFLWFYLSCKRQMKRPFFVLLLVLLPLGMSAFSRAEKEDSKGISIALYTDGDVWNQSVADELMNGSHSFDFYLCGSESELERDVASKKAECGYSFPAGLRKILDSGKYRRSIRLVTSPSTVAAELSSETVFAGLFRVYGRTLLETYAKEGEAFQALNQNWADKERSVWGELEVLFDKYLSDGSTFNFEYATAGGGIIERDTVKAVFPVRGISAVFIFVMGLAAAVTTGGDEKRGLFLTVPGGKRFACQLAQLAAPVMFSCLSAFFCLLVTDTVGEYGREGLLLVIYGTLTILFSFLLLRLISEPLILAGLIPFFIVGSLTACPVFVDLSAFVPVLKTVRYLFLPYYYLIF